MANNLVSDGRVLQTVCTGGAVTKGMLIRRGDIRGVALGTTVTAGDALRLNISGGVWSLAKIAAASTSWAVGGKVYGKATGSVGQIKLTGVATGAVIGTAIEAAVTGATLGVVKLNGFAV